MATKPIHICDKCGSYSQNLLDLEVQLPARYNEQNVYVPLRRLSRELCGLCVNALAADLHADLTESQLVDEMFKEFKLPEAADRGDAPASTKQPFCPDCGSKDLADDFCIGCGNDLPENLWDFTGSRRDPYTPK